MDALREEIRALREASASEISALREASTSESTARELASLREALSSASKTAWNATPNFAERWTDGAANRW